MNHESGTPDLPRFPPVYSIFLISAAALAYEILLMRLFSIIQWHHFAYMVISLALLGYGVSGTFLTLTRRWMEQRFLIAYVVNAFLFGLSAIICFVIVQRIPFNTLELLWDTEQWLYLLYAYLTLFIPFFFAANCICLTFTRFSGKIHRIYSFDLLGAGFGALGLILALFVMDPVTVLRSVGAMGSIAAGLAIVESRERRHWRLIALFLAMAVFTSLVPDPWLALNRSEYKGLSQALQVPNTQVIAERSSPLGQLTLIVSPEIPLRHAPGMSLNSAAEPPLQMGIFSDGDFLGAINRYHGDKQTLEYLDFLTSALPYHLAVPERALILGMGGGSGVLQALYHGVEQIEVVELNAQVAQLIQEDYKPFSGLSLSHDRLRVHIGEARGFLAGDKTRYGLIQMALLDASGVASAGLYALSENYLYTKEGLQEYLRHIQLNGLLALTRWTKLPPRDGLKILATAIEALRAIGINDPGARMLMIRGWKTSTLLMKNGRFTEPEINQLKAFCKERSFDIVYYPGMLPAEANIYNVLDEPYYYRGAVNLLGEAAETYLANYKFDISPATDDRPYFYNFFKWSVLPEILSLHGRGGLSLLEMGYPVMIVTLVQAIVVSLFLILIPLLFLKQETRGPGRSYAGRVALYFTSIGLAFLFIEIAFMQRFVLFLSHPLYAIAVILCGFLIFSGLGSRFSNHLVNAVAARPVFLIVVVLSLTALGYLWLVDRLFEAFIALSDPLKILISIGLIAPLAFCMGMPFPVGLAKVSGNAPQLVPWAWGINGCASLISAVLATVLAVHLGFSAVIMIAVALYLVAGMIRL